MIRFHYHNGDCYSVPTDPYATMDEQAARKYRDGRKRRWPSFESRVSPRTVVAHRQTVQLYVVTTRKRICGLTTGS